MKTYLKGAICAAVLVVVASGCNNFLKGGDLTKDPNNPLNATSRQFYGAVQSNLWQQQSGDLARLVSMWMQQTTGAARQAQGIYSYIGVTEGTYDAEFARAYQGGGLLDLRKIDSMSLASGDSIFLGVSKVVEAWLIGTTADVWGDIPYTQADSFFVYPQPALDPQQTVYDSVQSRLSQAIAELTSGAGGGPGPYDLVYGGAPARWIALAHTLKARFYLHTAEKLGTPAYASALAEANLGISSNAGDYIANFSGTQQGESNPWYQFVDVNGGTGRGGDIIGVPSHLDSLLRGSDPRDTVYFGEITDSIFVLPLTPTHRVLDSSFRPGDTTKVDTANSGGGFVSAARLNATFPQPFVTYNENLLIKAEAQFQTGDPGGALATLNQERAAWGTATPWHSSVSLSAAGAISLSAIMTEKYITLFQNVEVWNDYKRTCLPPLTPIAGGVNGVIPGRLLYPVGERQTNKNIPAVNAQPARNWNDPNACP